MLYPTDTFYFATVRKTTAAFGALFTNVVVNRYDQPGGLGSVLKTIKVPFSYGPSNKWIRSYNESRREGDDTRLRTFFPRMSFELIGIEYDRERKLQTMGAINVTNTGSDSLNAFLKQLNPVPYNYNFDLHITSKSLDDGLQIIEQILPNFTPSFNLTIKDIPEINLVRDVPVIFNGIDTLDDFEGDIKDLRVLTWTLHFKVKGYLYPNIKDATIIKEVIASIYNEEDMDEDSKQAVVTVSVDPIDAEPEDEWEALTTIEEIRE